MSLWKRGALAFVLVLCAAIALAPSTGPSKRIPNGVRISGVNVSNLDAGQARQVISARYGVPLRFRFDQREWTASPKRLGMHADIDGATSRALEAEKGDDIGVSVDVNRDEVPQLRREARRSVRHRPGERGRHRARRRPAPDRRLDVGREVRRQTMVRAIVRTLRTRIRQAVPLVTKTLKPSVSKAGFGPVIVIHRGRTRSSSSTARLRGGASALRPAALSTRLRPAASGSSTCRRTRGGARPTPTGRRA